MLSTCIWHGCTGNGADKPKCPQEIGSHITVVWLLGGFASHQMQMSVRFYDAPWVKFDLKSEGWFSHSKSYKTGKSLWKCRVNVSNVEVAGLITILTWARHLTPDCSRSILIMHSMSDTGYSYLISLFHCQVPGRQKKQCYHYLCSQEKELQIVENKKQYAMLEVSANICWTDIMQV